MKVKDAHMQAYPFIEPEQDDNIKAYHPGAALRDQFAMVAMHALIVTADKRSAEEAELWVGSAAYEIADEMMKARK